MVDDGSGVQRLGSATLRTCPGFCGRVDSISAVGNISYSTCQACSWGSRSSISTSVCTPCFDFLPAYDWLYLLFVAIVPLLLHSLFVFINTPKHCSRKLQLAHYVCCFVECSFSTIFSLLIVPPRGSLVLGGCPKWSLKEWYPNFYNPVVNHTYTLRCAHELVFPLYSLPFIYLAFCLLSLLILRSCLYATIFRKSNVNSKPYYAALRILPILTLCHFLFAGLLYYSYPYIILFTSLIINTIHLAMVHRRGFGRDFKRNFLCLRNVVILLIHMALFGFSSLVLMLNFSVGRSFWAIAVLFLCIPLPSLYYVLTATLSHPKFVHYYF